MDGSEVVEISDDLLKMRSLQSPDKWPLDGPPSSFSTLKARVLHCCVRVDFLLITLEMNFLHALNVYPLSLQVDVPEFVPGQSYVAPATESAPTSPYPGTEGQVFLLPVLLTTFDP